MNRRLAAVNADLHAPHAEALQHLRAFGSDEQRIRLKTYVELQPARRCENFFQIFAKKNFSAAKREKEGAGASQLLQRIHTFARGQLAVVLVVEVTVHASLVAAIGQIKMHA